MSKLVTSLSLCSALVVGCAADAPPGPEVLPALELPPVPENGIQIITPIVHDIQAGSDNEICSWTDTFIDVDTNVRSAAAWQTEPGHHVVLYYTMDHQPGGLQRPCTDNDMASFRLVAGLGNDGTPTAAPGNLVYQIPAGAQIVVNQHYLNVSDEVLDAQAVVNVDFAAPGGSYTPSSSLAILNTAMEVPTGVHSLDVHCDFDQQLKLWFMIPHMHRWGTNITVDVTRGETVEPMFDTAWEEVFTFHPPEFRVAPEAAMVVNPGDQIDVHCEWNNDTDQTLGFGFEMCVAYAQFVDDTGVGNRACDGGVWGEF